MIIVLASDAQRPTPFDLDAEELQAFAQSASIAALREAAKRDVAVFGRTALGNLAYSDASELLRGAEDQRVLQTGGQIVDGLRRLGHEVLIRDLELLDHEQLGPGDCDLLIVDINAPQLNADARSAVFGHLVPTLLVAKHAEIEPPSEVVQSPDRGAFLGSLIKPLSENMLHSVARAAQTGERLTASRRQGSVVA